MMTAPVTTADVPAHSGLVRERTHPELYDIVTFIVAAVLIVLLRRALRARFAKRRDLPPED